MIGNKVMHRLMMTGGDGHYVNNLVNGSRMLDFFGDVATELLVRCDGDLSLFLGYSDGRFLAPIHVGDFMEYHGWIEKKGRTSYTLKFEAYKVITVPDDFKKESYFLDGIDGKNMMGLKQSAALVCDPPHPVRHRHRHPGHPRRLPARPPGPRIPVLMTDPWYTPAL